MMRESVVPVRRQDGGSPYGEPPSRRLNMKVHANILGSILLAAALSVAAAEPTKVEDFIQPRSSDAIRDMANVLASEGVKGHFAMVGYLGKKLVDWRRFDVIDALKAHHVGTQTLYHSLHPNITEYTDIEDFDAAYVRALEEEARGIGMLQAATGKDHMWCSVLPGNGNTIVGLYLYADMGIPFFGGGTGMYEDETKCGDIWYCNQNQRKTGRARQAAGRHVLHASPHGGVHQALGLGVPQGQPVSVRRMALCGSARSGGDRGLLRTHQGVPQEAEG